MTAGRFITCSTILWLLLAGGSSVRAQSSLVLPTPRNHYETFPPGISGRPLLQNLVQSLDPQAQKSVLTFVASSQLLSRVPKEQALAQLTALNWTPWKPVLLEFVVHHSQVFDMIPVKYQAFLYPIVHDSLLYFLDHLPEGRLLEKLVDIAYLPDGSSRSASVKAFVAKTPSLQKLGQILARNQALSPEYQEALQQFENGIHSLTRDELVQFIAEDIGTTNIVNHQVAFADAILAEGSVGAVIRATWIP